jgi:hypothetical protein
MTKALLGHVGPPSLMAAELRRLRQRVSDLEAALDRLKDERGGAASQQRGPAAARGDAGASISAPH